MSYFNVDQVSVYAGGTFFATSLLRFELAVAVAHELSQTERRRRVVSMSILKYTKHATLLPYSSRSRSGPPSGNIFGQRNKRQTAENIAGLSETGVLVYRRNFARVAVDDIHFRDTVPFSDRNKLCIKLDPKIRIVIRQYLATYFVIAPVPTPSSITTLSLSGKMPSSICHARSGELGATAPTLSGFFKNACRN